MTPQPSALATLQPCPFCGGEVGMLEFGRKFQAVCRTCLAETKWSVDSPDVAIAAWNKRWPTQAQGEAVASMDDSYWANGDRLDLQIDSPSLAPLIDKLAAALEYARDFKATLSNTDALLNEYKRRKEFMNEQDKNERLDTRTNTVGNISLRTTGNTHPSPSTAALREALRELIENVDKFLAGRLGDGNYSNLDKSRVRARTLLEGDNRG